MWCNCIAPNNDIVCVYYVWTHLVTVGVHKRHDISSDIWITASYSCSVTLVYSTSVIVEWIKVWWRSEGVKQMYIAKILTVDSRVQLSTVYFHLAYFYSIGKNSNSPRRTARLLHSAWPSRACFHATNDTFWSVYLGTALAKQVKIRPRASVMVGLQHSLGVGSKQGEEL